MISLRSIFEKMGYEVVWNNELITAEKLCKQLSALRVK
jgi:hypothetical protein